MTLTQEEMDTARRVAYKIGAKWQGVELEDLEQHLLLWIIENHKYVEAWRDETGDGKLFVSLRREASKYCARETEHYAHISVDTNNFYTADRVTKILPHLWEYSEWQQAQTVGSEATAIITDVRQSYFGLNKSEQELLSLRFRDGLTFADLGARFKVSEDAARKRVKRAVERLVSRLNGEPLVWHQSGRKPGPPIDAL